MTIQEYKKKYADAPNAVALQQIIARHYMGIEELSVAEEAWIKQHIKENKEAYQKQINKIEKNTK